MGASQRRRTTVSEVQIGSVGRASLTEKGDVVMSDHTAIEWTDATWNPVTGCTKVSPGCAHCYIERTPAFRINGRAFVKGAIPVQLHDNRIEQPLHWRRPRRVFVNSLSDLYHDDVPDTFIVRVFETMRRAHWHQFQILTKRSVRLRELASRLPWPVNVWQGVSVENAAHVHRIADLQAVPASVRFLSIEPLLGPIPELPLAGVDWVIVGGESGPRRRPMDPGWVADIRDQCVAAGAPFFFKQWGGRVAKAGGRELDGRTWDDMPASTEARSMGIA
jgi:protein gp37